LSGTNGLGPGSTRPLVIEESKIIVKEADRPDLVIDFADADDLGSLFAHIRDCIHRHHQSYFGGSL